MKRNEAMQPSHLRGAVDLAARKAAADAAAEAARRQESGGGAVGGGAVIDVTETNFEAEVLQRSRSVPVVLDFWASWCEPCKQLGPILERLAEAANGQWILGKVDIDANPQLARVFGVQGIPFVAAVLAGQPAPLFSGALPEAQVRSALDQVVQAAQQVIPGYPGTVAAPGAADGTAAPTAPVDPTAAEFDAAFNAIQAGDFDAAAAAYKRVLAERPADRDAQAGLAQVELLRRLSGTDPAQAMQAAAANPDDVAAQCTAADIEVVENRVAEAFDRLIETVRRTSGDERDTARVRLLELFEIVGPEDPRVGPARAKLTNVLF